MRPKTSLRLTLLTLMLCELLFSAIRLYTSLRARLMATAEDAFEFLLAPPRELDLCEFELLLSWLYRIAGSLVGRLFECCIEP